MMYSKEIREHLQKKEYDVFGDDLDLELQMFPQEYESIDAMVEDQPGLWRFLCEDFPERYDV